MRGRKRGRRGKGRKGVQRAPATIRFGLCWPVSGVSVSSVLSCSGSKSDSAQLEPSGSRASSSLARCSLPVASVVEGRGREQEEEATVRMEATIRDRKGNNILSNVLFSLARHSAIPSRLRQTGLPITRSAGSSERRAAICSAAAAVFLGLRFGSAVQIQILFSSRSPSSAQSSLNPNPNPTVRYSLVYNVKTALRGTASTRSPRSATVG